MDVSGFVALALKFHATVYGYGELYCGDYDSEPQPCDSTAITASGEPFNPDELIAAVPLPRNRIMRPLTIGVLDHAGRCLQIRVIDKKNERFIGNSGLDLSPGAVLAITGKPAPRHFSGKLGPCS